MLERVHIAARLWTPAESIAHSGGMETEFLQILSADWSGKFQTYASALAPDRAAAEWRGCGFGIDEEGH
jgi:hypothetical protein